ncbi:hypothetical protein PMAYCL1PPCAC_10590, partial [Pristionchus mayeri]
FRFPTCRLFPGCRNIVPSLRDSIYLLSYINFHRITNTINPKQHDNTRIMPITIVIMTHAGRNGFLIAAEVVAGIVLVSVAILPIDAGVVGSCLGQLKEASVIVDSVTVSDCSVLSSGVEVVQ